MIEVKYKNTEKQICDFSMYRATSSESYKKTLKKKSNFMFLIFLVAGLIYIFAGFNMKEQGKLPMGLIFAGIFFLFAVLSLFFFEKYANKHVARTIRKNLKKKGNVIDSNIKVKFHGKAIKVLRGKEKSIIKTNSIIDVIKLNKCLCIAAKGDIGIAIPFDSFKKEEDLIMLEKTLKNYIK